MPSSPPPDRRGAAPTARAAAPPARAAALAVALTVALAACSATPRRAATGVPTSTLLSTDEWAPPAVTGPASTANFCSLLTALYRHEASLALATPGIRRKIVGDYLATVPQLEAQAPPGISAPARTYLSNVARVLQALLAAGLDYRKLAPGTATALLLDPTIKAAGNQVLDFSQQQCHYAIGAA